MRVAFSRPLWSICLVLALGLFAKEAVDHRLTAAPSVHLSSIPRNLESWKSVDLPMNPEVEKMLDPDLLIWRAYSRSGEEPIYFYGVFYAFQGVGRTMHSPLNCYPGGGWAITDHRKVTLKGKKHPENRIVSSRILVSKNEFHHVLFYWYYAAGETATGQFSNKFKTLSGAVLKGRNDGGLITVSAPLDKDGKPPEALETEFLPLLLDWLAIRPVFRTGMKEVTKSGS